MSAESFDSQKARSACSVANAGNGSDRRLVIDHALLSAHISRGDHADQRSIVSKREGQMKPPSKSRTPKRPKPLLTQRVRTVMKHEKRLMKKHLFRLAGDYIVLVEVFSSIADIPVKADDAVEINHQCI
jgi:hypothetical protein